MTTTKGVLLIAKNNGTVDYAKQAIFSAKRIKQYLDVPVSVITDSTDYLLQIAGDDLFDFVIPIEYNPDVANMRHYFDGTLSNRQLSFKNNERAKAYHMSPYNETLLLDTDYIICSDLLANCFGAAYEIMAFKESEDLAGFRDTSEFIRTNDYGIDFWWATAIYFRKSPFNEVFFNLISFIEENWDHYRDVYQINTPLFRNDYALSIAIHIINGFNKGEFIAPLPGKHHYILDKDLLVSVKEDEMLLLVEQEHCLGQYTPITTKGQDIHVMNKFSLGRIINNE